MLILKECNLAEIVVFLFEGKTMVLPTETSYGLCCDATNQQAVDAIFRIKARSEDKPLLVVVHSVEMARRYMQWNDALEQLAQQRWPGPLTVVAQSVTGSGLARGVVASNNTVAVRVTAHPILQFLCKELDRPLVATSANLSGKGDVYDPQQLIDLFSDRLHQPDVLLDYGALPANPPTTIVSVVDGTPRLLRQGAVRVDVSS